MSLIYSYAIHSVHVIDLHPLNFWDHRFESWCRHGCSSCVCCV